MNRIKELRKTKHLTQIQLCDMINVAQPTLSGWEANKWQPDFESLKKIANIFNVSVDYLIGNTDTPFKPLEWTEEEKALGVGNYPTKLSEDEWEIIELFSDLKSVCGDNAVNAVKTMISTLIEQKKKD